MQGFGLVINGKICGTLPKLKTGYPEHPLMRKDWVYIHWCKRGGSTVQILGGSFSSWESLKAEGIVLE